MKLEREYAQAKRGFKRAFAEWEDHHDYELGTVEKHKRMEETKTLMDNVKDDLRRAREEESHLMALRIARGGAAV